MGHGCCRGLGSVILYAEVVLLVNCVCFLIFSDKSQVLNLLLVGLQSIREGRIWDRSSVQELSSLFERAQGIYLRLQAPSPTRIIFICICICI